LTNSVKSVDLKIRSFDTQNNPYTPMWDAREPSRTRKTSRTEMSAVEESIRAILTVSIASTLKEAGFDAVVSFELSSVASALRCLLNESKVAVVQFEKGKNVTVDVQLVLAPLPCWMSSAICRGRRSFPHIMLSNSFLVPG
jgi:hypothetical protein